LDHKSVQFLIGISSNNLQVCSGHHCMKAIKTRKTQAF
jgi:hypothetical protein